jgi:hypothetical protein
MTTKSGAAAPQRAARRRAEMTIQQERFELRLGNPRPSVANPVLPLQCGRDVRLLAIGERPNLVHLQNFARQSYHQRHQCGHRFPC